MGAPSGGWAPAGWGRTLQGMDAFLLLLVLLLGAYLLYALVRAERF
ncbi:potassium-transporting ATPase subunit F [Deinococcus multiflagellatus]|uniref:Potassium-transporting ATPase subunit F n=1 Tax=Deinococcus multiflagellatus TaxID=1656887 RepID=A0ABW1ZHN6_9DEIO